MYSLTTSISFKLNRLGGRMGAFFGRKLGEYGVSLPAYRVLAALHEAPRQSLADLATMTGAELSTMSRTITALVARGLVTRTRLPHNTRTVEIELTAAGLALADELLIHAAHYEEVAASAFSQSDLAKLRRMLDTISAQIGVIEAEFDEAGR